MTDPIPLKEFAEAEGAEDWRLVSEGACAFFRTGSFTESVRFVSATATSMALRIISRLWTFGPTA